jgi:beta-glucanase (GH16 family)
MLRSKALHGVPSLIVHCRVNANYKRREEFNSWWTSTDGANWPAPFDQPFSLVLNLAVGGEWPGPPDDSTPFPASLEADYIRVFARLA